MDGKARRGRIILKAAEGKNNANIAREVKQSIDMVRLWRRHWRELAPIGWDDLSVEERLDDLKKATREGLKKYVALARKLVIALWRFVTTGEPLEGVVLRPAS